MTGTRACIWIGAAFLGATVILQASGSVASGQEGQPWKVQGKLLGKPRSLVLEDGRNPDSKKSADVSGIACANGTGFPRLCLVVDDESQGAQIVILEEGRLIAGDFVRLIDEAYENKPLELDAEAVSFADGYFYVMGSHGRPRHEFDVAKEAKNLARAKASRYLFRIRFPNDAVDLQSGKRNADPEIERSALLADLLRGHAAIAPFVDAALEENGLTVEGVAVRDGILYAGMRGPTLEKGVSVGHEKTLENDSAAILAVPLAVLFDGGTDEASLLTPNLGQDTRGFTRGVRDMVQFGSGILVLAGPVQDPKGDQIADGDYSIYFHEPEATHVDATHGVRKLHDLKSFGTKAKPEALLPLDLRDGSVRLLLLFDGPDEGDPTPISIELQ